MILNIIFNNLRLSEKFGYFHMGFSFYIEKIELDLVSNFILSMLVIMILLIRILFDFLNSKSESKNEILVIGIIL
jgi:hypothetical protein